MSPVRYPAADSRDSWVRRTLAIGCERRATLQWLTMTGPTRLQPPFVSASLCFGGSVLIFIAESMMQPVDAGTKIQGVAMRSVLRATVVVLLTAPVGLQADDVRLGTCEASVVSFLLAQAVVAG